MIKQLLLVVSFYATLGLAQSVTQNDSHSVKDTSLSEQIIKIEKSLKQLQEDVTLPHVDTQSLLAEMPITAETIDQRIDALAEPNQPPVTSQQLKQVTQLSSKLLKARDSVAAGQQQLQQQTTLLIDDQTAINAVKQLLDNPLNQEKITTKEQQKVSQFSQNLANIKTQYQQLQSRYDTQLQTLNTAIGLLNRWDSALAAAQLNHNGNSSQHNSEKNRLIDQQKGYQDEAKALTNQLNKQRGVAELANIEQLQEAIYQKQTMAWLTRIDIDLDNIIKEDLTLSEGKEHIALTTLENQLGKVTNALNQLENLRTDVENRFSQFQKHVEIKGANPTLDEAFTTRLKAIAFQHLQLNSKPEQLTQAINQQQQKDLLTRDNLFTKATLGIRFSDIYQSLVQIAYQVKISITTLIQQVLQNPYHIITLAISGLLLIYSLGYISSRWLSHPSRKRGDEIGITSSLRKFFNTLKRHRYLLVFLLFIIMLVRVSKVPYPSSDIIRTLAYILGGLVVWLELTRIEVKLQALPKRLAKRNMWGSLLLVLMTLLYALAKISAISPTLVLLYEKLLMLTIMGFAWITQGNLISYLKQQKNKINGKAYAFYLWVSNSLPWFIIGTCALNIIGYDELSWLILTYLGVGTLYCLLLTVGLVVINQLRKQLKLYCLRRFTYGAFIAQDIVSPMNIIIKALWLWGVTKALFQIMGWDKNSYLINQTLAFFNHPLLTFSSNTITLQTIVLLLLAIYLIFRIAKWLKTFSYHWLYAKISDFGVRNSLSIFTQYVAILSGVLIAMNALGIDLTSLAVFAGALGVGVGLGLQDIAKNFISGILLLIERPLRSGDWVEIDGSEGTVKSIGMRAITVETFDNQEVIIPNGNAIGNSFTNYTHSNSLIRTVLYVGAGYSCDPNLVIKTLHKVLDNTKGILKEPAFLVAMWEYADSSINYRIQYYINMDHSGLWETKTAVLKAIWYEFKANEIEIPFPQRDIHFRNLLQSEAPIISDKQNDDKVL